MNRRAKNKGFTLIETLIAAGLFVVIALAIYQAYGNILEIIVRNQWRSDAISILHNEIEIIRSMKYEDIGILNGSPAGMIALSKDVAMDGNTFTVSAAVRSIDDPFDGTFGGFPNDTAPADYKLVEIEAVCNSCSGFGKVSLTTTVAPKGLENTSNNGALFINVFDANGNPVSDANVTITNSALTPQITINDRTNNNGVLQLVDIPTSTMAYQIAVSKAGFSSDRTYPPGEVGNPNPTKPDATVVSQAITSISFAVDRTSSLNINTSDDTCNGVGSVDFGLNGTKLIGTNPDVLKYSQIFTSDSNGQQPISSLEWDTYNIINNDQEYDLIGTIPLSSFSIIPATTTNLSMVMAPKNPSALLVTVRDGNGQPVNNAVAELTKTGYSQSFYTGRRSLSQTDWSGAGYSSQSGNVDTETAPGEIKLTEIGGSYSTTSEWLISNTIDFGTLNTTFYNFSWMPLVQPPQTGTESLKFQIATNNDNATWDFLGPDGTVNTFYTESGAVISSANDNTRYLRYKVFLHTNDIAYTPFLDSVKIDFSSSCAPSGQAFFNGLDTGIYTLNVSKGGYQPFSDSNITVSSPWQEHAVQLLEQ